MGGGKLGRQGERERGWGSEEGSERWNKVREGKGRGDRAARERQVRLKE